MVSSFPCLSRTCSKKVAKGIECDNCKRWAHPKCSGIPPDHYKIYAQLSWLDWMCPECKDGAREAYMQKTTPKDIRPKQATSSHSLRVSYAEVVRATATPPPGKKVPRLPHLTPKIRASTPKRLQHVPTTESVCKQPVNSLAAIAAKIESLSKAVSQLQGKPTRLRASPRALNVLVLNQAEPYVREAKARKDMERRKARDLMRKAGMRAGVPITRVHRVGKWRGSQDEHEDRPPRPILIQFRLRRDRDEFLCKSERILNSTNGLCRIVPDEPSHEFGARARVRPTERKASSLRTQGRVVGGIDAICTSGIGETPAQSSAPSESTVGDRLATPSTSEVTIQHADVVLTDIGDDPWLSCSEDNDEVEAAPASTSCIVHADALGIDLEGSPALSAVVLSPEGAHMAPKNLEAPRALRSRVNTA